MRSARVDITRRIKLPRYLAIAPDTKVALTCKRVVRQHDENMTDLELFFKFENSKKTVTFETDTVIERYEIPKPAKNKKSWERVRQLVLDGYTPDEACLEVALVIMAGKWKFSLEDSNAERNTVRLNIHRGQGEHFDIVATVRNAEVNPFLTDGPEAEKLEEDEEEAHAV